MYPVKDIEKKWQKYWEENNTYKTADPPSKKYYILEMFPYPSGDLHVGHLRNYVVVDTIARYRLMKGFDVLHPIGWDAFGLPAENAAIEREISPKQWTVSNINLSRTSLKNMGISYDWNREILTCEPNYYRWTQWLFLLLFKKNLAYRKSAYVNWCTGCKTVLANEQVENGTCYRCHAQVIKKPLTQWFFKIGNYAERLLSDIDKLKGWPENVKTLQRNWIGKSTGVEIGFKLLGTNDILPVFTTRPDTIYGVTFLTIAPEHPLALKLAKERGNHLAEVKSYIDSSLNLSETERARIGREKEASLVTGVFTGKYAINPLSGEKVKIFIADYVSPGYGTGIIMGVPAHDSRDLVFAKKYNLPIKEVIVPEWSPELVRDKFSLNKLRTPKEAFTDEGIMVNSGPFTGKPSKQGIELIAHFVEQKGIGRRKVNYRLNDWLISRQRYWGTPIPIIHCETCGLVPDYNLPVLLPEGEIDFLPKGRSPLEDLKEFINVKCPKCGNNAKRDPDTMDTFVDSTWYYLRYIDPHNNKQMVAGKKAREWLPVDLYIGGIEHATMHLLYFRFITKVLYDEGIIPVDEPVNVLFNQGMIKDKYGQIMSSSKGNNVPIGPLVDKHGADIARLAILFIGPPEKDGIWHEESIQGVKKFLNRVYNLVEEYTRNPKFVGGTFQSRNHSIGVRKPLLYKTLNLTIKKVTEDIETFGLNTAISFLMEFVNELYKTRAPEHQSTRAPDELSTLVKLLAPFAPHLSEELWLKLGHKDSIFKQKWPSYEKIQQQTVKIAVQVNAKVRAELITKKEITKTQVQKLALDIPKVQKYIQNKEIKNVIFVPQKLINIVVGTD